MDWIGPDAVGPKGFAKEEKKKIQGSAATKCLINYLIKITIKPIALIITFIINTTNSNSASQFGFCFHLTHDIK